MKKFILLSIIILSTFEINAQSGAAINTTGSAAAPSAILDVSSTNAGILIPRMTETQKNAISSPATGLMIYQTDGVTGFWYYDGTAWTQAIGPAGPTGAASTVPGPSGATGPTGSAASCPAAPTGQTLINYNGCLYVKDIDETGTYTWANANSKCTSLGAGWYLPSKMELDVLYQNWNQPSNGGTCNGGPCPLSGFIPVFNYWSSTAYSSGGGYAWRVLFDSGDQGYSNETNTYKVRCVRR